MDRVILHSDCNSFYASVECFLHPELRNIPVSVGGDSERRHGVILASNQLAKKYGVRTGEPLWEARKKCPALTIVEPHHDIYHKFSLMAREIYLEYSDLVEPFGPDEAWIDVSENASSHADGIMLAHEINRRIKNELGITVSVGVSWNKIFSKLGSDYKKPDAVTGISRENFRSIVWPLPVSALLFVGNATNRSLQRVGIKTIGDIAAADPDYLRRTFGKHGSSLYIYACGLDDSPVVPYGYDAPAKSVSNSTTTARDISNDQDAAIIFCSLSESVSRRLREQGMRGNVVTISIRDVSLNCITRQKQLGHYTSCGREIAAQAMELFCESYKWTRPIRSLGVCVSGLASCDVQEQLSLFDDELIHAKREQLETATDELKRKFGKQAVYPARLLTDKELSGIIS